MKRKKKGVAMPLSRETMQMPVQDKPVITKSVALLETMFQYSQILLLKTGRLQTGLHPLAAPEKNQLVLSKKTVLWQ